MNRFNWVASEGEDLWKRRDRVMEGRRERIREGLREVWKKEGIERAVEDNGLQLLLLMMQLYIPKLSGEGGLCQAAVVEVQNEITTTVIQTDPFRETPRTLHPSAGPEKQDGGRCHWLRKWQELMPSCFGHISSECTQAAVRLRTQTHTAKQQHISLTTLRWKPRHQNMENCHTCENTK